MYMLPGGGWGAGWYNKQLPSKVKRESHKESCRKIPRRSLGRAILTTSSVQSLSHVQLFAILWTVACQASLSFTTSQSLLKLMSIESVMPSTISSSVIPFSSCFQSFPASGSFPMSQFLASGGQSTGDSALASILPMNIQNRFPLGWTGLTPCCPRDSEKSSPTPQFKSINSSALSFLYSPILTSILDYWKKHSFN